MDDPHDDTDVPSGTTDGAQMESTSPPVLRLDLAASMWHWAGPEKKRAHWPTLQAMSGLVPIIA